MITLYCAPSTASLVVHWLLLELSVPFEYRWLDLERREHKSPEYLAINPAGVVPTLVVDGRPIREAAAIAMYLAEAFPVLDLAPAPGLADGGDLLRATPLLHCAHAVRAEADLGQGGQLVLRATDVPGQPELA